MYEAKNPGEIRQSDAALCDAVFCDAGLSDPVSADRYVALYLYCYHLLENLLLAEFCNSSLPARLARMEYELRKNGGWDLVLRAVDALELDEERCRHIDEAEMDAGERLYWNA